MPQAATMDRHKEHLLALRSRLREDITAIGDRLPDKVNPPGENSSIPTHPADMDTEGLDAEIALERNQEGLLDAVEQALRRMDDGTYGKCIDCGRKIPAARLEALPYTPFCTECARKAEGG